MFNYARKCSLLGDTQKGDCTYILYIGCNVNGVPTYREKDIMRVVGKVFPCFTLTMSKGYYVYRNAFDTQGYPLHDMEETAIVHISTDEPQKVDHLICLTKRAYRQECVGLVELNGMRFI
jgi:hypothetical protein